MKFIKAYYCNQEQTTLCATREDGTSRVVDSWNTDMWSLIHSQEFAVQPYVEPEYDLQEGIQQAIGLIDRKTGEFRRQFITDIAGQQMTYLRKQEVARQFLSEPDPDPMQYPRIMAAVGVVADTPRAVAELWAAKAAEWEQLDILIESRRESFKKQASEATSKEELEEVLNQFKNWSA